MAGHRQRKLMPGPSLAMEAGWPGGRTRVTRTYSDWRSKAVRRMSPSHSLIISTALEISPRYSPDGKRIAFVSNRSGSDEIWVCGGDGENPIRLSSFHGPLAGSPSWSPDGKRIVFDCRPEGNADIYVVSAEGGQPRRLTTDPAEDIVPSWSRDGRWIYFTSNRNADGGSGRLQIWKMPADGGEAVQMTRQGGFEPMESPDGQWLYFTQDRGSSSIRRMPTGGAPKRLSSIFTRRITAASGRSRAKASIRRRQFQHEVGHQILQLLTKRRKDNRRS